MAVSVTLTPEYGMDPEVRTYVEAKIYSAFQDGTLVVYSSPDGYAVEDLVATFNKGSWLYVEKNVVDGGSSPSAD